MVSARAVRGEFRLRAEHSEMNRTVLAHRYAAGAYHLSKPYWDGHALMVQWINPTAGVFAGDVLRSEVHVGSGASLLLTTPSATRIHRRIKPSDPSGESELHFEVDANGWLEVQSEWLIPQASSAFVQRTEIDLHQDAGLFYTELLAPGRVAHGETLVFDELDLRLRLRLDGTLLVQDRLYASRDRSHMLRAGDAALFVATVLVHLPTVKPMIVSLANKAIAQLTECDAGVTMLPEGLMMARLTSTSGMALKRGIAALRMACVPYAAGLGAPSRKL